MEALIAFALGVSFVVGIAIVFGVLMILVSKIENWWRWYPPRR